MSKFATQNAEGGQQRNNFHLVTLIIIGFQRKRALASNQVEKIYDLAVKYLHVQNSPKNYGVGNCAEFKNMYAVDTIESVLAGCK